MIDDDHAARERAEQGCEEFWAARRERLREKITAVLNPMALQTSQKVQEQDAAEIGRRRAPRQAGAVER